MRTNSEAEFTSKGAREAVPPVGGERAGAFQPTILFEAISGRTTIKSEESALHKASPGSWPWLCPHCRWVRPATEGDWGEEVGTRRAWWSGASCSLRRFEMQQLLLPCEYFGQVFYLRALFSIHEGPLSIVRNIRPKAKALPNKWAKAWWQYSSIRVTK